MDPRKLFVDSRFVGACVYCGARADSRDHVPSKVLLDEPYPPDLHVVDACTACNNGFSMDEAYLACLVECAISGSTVPERVGREKVRRLLAEKPLLAARVEASRVKSEDAVRWEPDALRVESVVLKLARAHSAFERAEFPLDEPHHIGIAPLVTLSDLQRKVFESIEIGLDLWPEIGSRAFIEMVGEEQSSLSLGGWVVVQHGRYRYAVSTGPAVRIVLSEYLACEVNWA